MDEFLVAIMSAIAILGYSILIFFLFEFKFKTYVRWGLLALIVVWVLVYLTKSKMDKARLKKIGVDVENYVYYQKFTSTGNKIAYVFTYLIQDFIYEVKKRNKAYNFSKGMFRFDDSLGEYYIDCRIGWYSYFKNNILKNRLSLHKLRIFSLNKCNQMILGVFPEQMDNYKKVQEEWKLIVDGLSASKKLKMSQLKSIEGASDLDSMIRKNLFYMELSRKFMRDNMDIYHEALKRQEKRKDDVREIKNLYIDIDKKDQE